MEEVAGAVLTVRNDPAFGMRLRRAARERAAVFTWDQVIRVLLSKIHFVARTKGLALISHSAREDRTANQLALDLRPRRLGVLTDQARDRRAMAS